MVENFGGEIKNAFAESLQRPIAEEEMLEAGGGCLWLAEGDVSGVHRQQLPENQTTAAGQPCRTACYRQQNAQ
jgi:hypothetical protein